MNPDFVLEMDSISKKNEEFYWNVFHKYPHGSLKTIEDVIEAENKPINIDYYERNK